MTQSSDYQKLRLAREQYEAIPVPPELSTRLEETIARILHQRLPGNNRLPAPTAGECPPLLRPVCWQCWPRLT